MKYLLPYFKSCRFLFLNKTLIKEKGIFFCNLKNQFILRMFHVYGPFHESFSSKHILKIMTIINFCIENYVLDWGNVLQCVHQRLWFYGIKFWLSFLLNQSCSLPDLFHFCYIKNNLNSGYELTWVRKGQTTIWPESIFFKLIMGEKNRLWCFQKVIRKLIKLKRMILF